jgi:hypothetical protein
MTAQPYKRPYLVDTTRYEQGEDFLEALSYEDKYFEDDKSEDPLVLIVDALLSVLEPEERTVVEMCIIAGMSQHEVARQMGYINSNGKEDHKMVSRRIKWAMKKLIAALEGPTFAVALAGDKLPVDQPKVEATVKLREIIKQLENSIREDEEDEE